MKEIKGFEGQYAITSCGKVWSYKSKKFLKSVSDWNGYLMVCLITNEGKQKMRKVHRLVAEAYIPNPDNKPQVNHKSEIKTDNNVNNLEWVTCAENINYGTAIQRRVANRLYTPIRCIETGEIFPTQEAAAQSINKNVQNISNCLHGKQKTAGGYHWERVIEK